MSWDPYKGQDFVKHTAPKPESKAPVKVRFTKPRYSKSTNMSTGEVSYSSYQSQVSHSIPFASLLNFSSFLIIFLLFVLGGSYSFFKRNLPIYMPADAEGVNQPYVIHQINDMSDFELVALSKGVSTFNLTKHLPSNLMSWTNGDRETQFNADSVAVLTLTNLIQNGQFTNNITGWEGYPNSYVWDSGTFKFTGHGDYYNSRAFYTQTSNVFTRGQQYYVIFDYNTTFDNNRIYFNEPFNTPEHSIPSANIWNKLSQIGSVVFTKLILQQNFSSCEEQTGKTIYFDNVMAFLTTGSSYTKTQIDNVLINFGYLPYNTAFSLPDSADVDFANQYYLVSGTSPSTSILYSINDLQADGLFVGLSVSAIKVVLSDYVNNGLTASNVGYFFDGSDEWDQLSVTDKNMILSYYGLSFAGGSVVNMTDDWLPVYSLDDVADDVKLNGSSQYQDFNYIDNGEYFNLGNPLISGLSSVLTAIQDVADAIDVSSAHFAYHEAYDANSDGEMTVWETWWFMLDSYGFNFSS